MNNQCLDDFVAFLDREVASAITELDGIAEGSRKHLQKLVYTNLVDRFDATVDHFMLDNALQEPLLTEALEKLTEPMPEGAILRLLANAANLTTHVGERVKGTIRDNILRERHSKKVRKLLEVFAPSQDLNVPRVNVSTGAITKKFKPQNGKIAASIPGYADWLYSRRNAIVHGGGGTTMLQNDLNQLKKLYKCDAAKQVKLKIGSITNAVEFYRAFVVLVTEV